MSSNHTKVFCIYILSLQLCRNAYPWHLHRLRETPRIFWVNNVDCSRLHVEPWQAPRQFSHFHLFLTDSKYWCQVKTSNRIMVPTSCTVFAAYRDDTWTCLDELKACVFQREPEACSLATWPQLLLFWLFMMQRFCASPSAIAGAYFCYTCDLGGKMDDFSHYLWKVRCKSKSLLTTHIYLSALPKELPISGPKDFPNDLFVARSEMKWTGLLSGVNKDTQGSC